MKLSKLTPNFEVNDIGKTIEFYRQNFGFKLDMAVPKTQDAVHTSLERDTEYVYAMVSRDGVQLMFQRSDSFKQDIIFAKQSGLVQAVKLYPAGATTNSADGVTDLQNCYPVLEEMQKQGLPLLVHGEVTHSDVDIFDREKRFLDEVLAPLLVQFPQLKLVVEHITTKDSAQFVLAQNDNIGATITPQHLLFNRNHLLVGGVKPHFYCLPILKRNIHQQALLEVATSGNPKFFLGTDSAPHATHLKENACGCAGCYSASIALPLYATAFEQVGKIDKLNDFAGRFGAEFYGLPINQQTITLKKSPMIIPSHYHYLEDKTLTPLMAGETLEWSIVG